MTAPEFTRRIPLDMIGDAPRDQHVAADAAERAALARRFDLHALDRLVADARIMSRAGVVHAEGRLAAAGAQRCVVTDEPVAFTLDEAFHLRFADLDDGGDEVELSEDDLDTLPLDGAAIDLGEAVAETMALALPPFPRSAGAADALRAAGVMSEEEAAQASSPFAALKGRFGAAD